MKVLTEKVTPEQSPRRRKRKVFLLCFILQFQITCIIILYSFQLYRTVVRQSHPLQSDRARYFQYLPGTTHSCYFRERDFENSRSVSQPILLTAFNAPAADINTEHTSVSKTNSFSLRSLHSKRHHDFVSNSFILPYPSFWGMRRNYKPCF